MSEWIHLDPTKFAAPRKVQFKGVQMDVFASPYDLPEAVRSTFDKKQGILAIDLKYVADDEALEEQCQERNVRIFLGKDSRRLRRIELPASDQDVPATTQHISSAVDSLLSRLAGVKRRVNYEIAGKAIQDAAVSALSPLVTF